MQLLEVDNPVLTAQEPRKHPLGWDYNKRYDGVLGEPDKNPPKGVWFSATLYEGNIPIQTPYPTGKDEGKKYWRVSIKAKNFDLLKKEINLYLAASTMAGLNSTQNSLVFDHQR